MENEHTRIRMGYCTQELEYTGYAMGYTSWSEQNVPLYFYLKNSVSLCRLLKKLLCSVQVYIPSGI